MSFIYNTFVYKPLYNGLIYLMDVIPWIDAGVAIVIFTIIVKLILFPLSKKAVTTQIKMRKIEPELAEIKKQYKNDKNAYALKTMELYKANKINPFASFFLILIQLPFIFALYKIFLTGFDINPSLLYSFVAVPADIASKLDFLGLVNITGKSLILAILAGVSSYIQIKYSAPMTPPKKSTEDMTKEEKFRNDLARTMNLQMRFMLPALAFIVSWTVSAAIAIYWITSNLFTLAQELVIRRTIAAKDQK